MWISGYPPRPAPGRGANGEGREKGGGGRGRGGANALGNRVYTAEQIAEREKRQKEMDRKFAEEMDKKYESVGGFIGQLKIRMAEDALAEIERKAEAIRMKDREYRARKEQDAFWAKLRAEQSDSDDD